MTRRRAGVVLVILLVIVLGVMWWLQSHPLQQDGRPTLIEAETLQGNSDDQEVRDDDTASGGAKYILWENSNVSGSFTTEGRAREVVVRAKADFDGDAYPRITVRINDDAHEIEIDNEYWEEYLIELKLKPGAHNIVIEYTNDWEDRGVILDAIIIGNNTDEYQWPEADMEEAEQTDEPLVYEGEDDSIDGELLPGLGSTDATEDPQVTESAMPEPTESATLPETETQDEVESSPTASEAPIADAQPVANVCLTDGSGGAKTNRFHQKFAANGMNGEYHLYGENVGDEPVGLLLQFHGDGGYEFENYETYKLPGMAEVARDNNLLMVAVRSPDNVGDRTWWEEGDKNAAWLQKLIDTEIYAKYPIDRSRVWLSGFSGGAQLVSQFYLPHYADTMCGGGALISGGGSANSFSPGEITASDAFKQQFEIWFYTGTADRGAENGFDAYTEAQAGAQYYRDFGFTRVKDKFVDGLDHDELDEVTMLRELVQPAK